jgi:hypothetical protein
MRPCFFTFSGDDTYAGLAHGTTWNGFDNVSITPAVRDQIVADMVEAGWDDEDCVAELRRQTPDEDGLIDLSNGWATQLLADNGARA